MATDAAGIRTVLATYEEARKKNLGIVAGTQRRHQAGYLETIKRIHDGAIGDIVGGQVFWNQGGLWNNGRQPNWSDTEWQIRNWLYFTWLSGDHIVEQHVHNIDVTNWVLRAHPVKAIGMGGRQQRTDPKYGHIYDHFAVDFEYPNGAQVMSMCRQIDGAANSIGESFIGTKGSSDASSKDHRRRTVDLSAARAAGEPVRAGAHRPGRQHPRGQAAQRAAHRGREHADARSWAARRRTRARS